MKSKLSNNLKSRVPAACAVILAAWAMMIGCPVANAQTTTSDLLEVVRLSQAHMTDDVILTYIKTSGKVYNLSADDMIYLSGQGVSQPVISAMVQTSGAATAAAPSEEASAPPPAVAITAPPETPTIDYFQAHLTPYGHWIDVPGVGTAWVPAEANVPGWRPYMDAGHWEFTDAGWFWHSDYIWGDMPFHYGRWINNDFTGGRWAWVPGYDWAPSWVSWREGPGGLGWAPLPWGVEFRPGLGLYWHGAAVVAGVDFGLGFGAFVFVGTDHFWAGDYHRYVFDEVRAREFYVHSDFHVGYRVEGGHLMAEGLGRDHMREITHHEVVVQRVSELRKVEEHNNFAKRTEEHRELARVVVRRHETARPEASRAPATREHTTGKPAEGPTPTSGHSGLATGKPGETSSHPAVATGKPGETPGHPGSTSSKAGETPAHPGVATGATRGTMGHPGMATGPTTGTTGHATVPGGTKAPLSHPRTNSASSKPAPSPEKQPGQ
jgi:hypothetical protein